MDKPTIAYQAPQYPTGYRSVVLFVLFLALTGLVNCGTSADPGGWVSNDAPLTSPGRLTNAPSPLVTPTYDGSGQTVEPSVLYFPNGWQGHTYWMVVSPYPREEDTFENPSILVSEDGLHWSVPAGLTNPIEFPKHGVLADATGVYDEQSNQLWVYYLNDVPGPVLMESLVRTTSSDGIHWSTPKVLLTAPGTFVNSPSVNQLGNTFFLWSVDTGSGCGTQTSTVNLRTSPDGVAWSVPKALSITQPGYVIWHLNTIPVPSKGQWMSLLAAYPLGSHCSHTELFFANSRDGIHWQTYSEPMLTPVPGWDSREIYRSSLLYHPNTALLQVWYSAFKNSSENADKAWHVGYTQKTFPVQ
jgi:hypothetical protein